MGLSKSNIKYVQSLRIKKFRQKYHEFIVEGDKSVQEVLHSDWDIKKLYHTTLFMPKGNFKESELISASEMERLSQHKSPQNALAIVGTPNHKLDTKQLKGKITLALDGIQDPGNLGTMVRLCDWYGIENLICSLETVDLYNHKTVAATMGSFLRVKVHYASLPEVITSSGIEAYAATMEGENVHQLKSPEEGILIIGSEGQGISDEIDELVKNKISIPRFGQAESLNAGIAAAILLDNLVRVEE